jgi:dihydroorotate dehydrogenase (NAD+) catalytic subunit
MRNPLMTASGTCGYGEELEPHLDMECLGALVTKGISLEPCPGNPPPRIVETPSGMLNAIGLENVGVERFIEEKCPYLRGRNVPVVVNFWGDSIEGYVGMAERLSGVSGLSGLEMNISCPNVKAGGMSFGADPLMSSQVVEAVRRVTSLPLMVKLSPNVRGITEVARSVEEAGADAVSLVNTFAGMAVDVERRVPKLGNVTGGLSGPAIRPIAVRMVWEVSQVVGIPVVGIGGIRCAEDALEFLIAGASAIQVGSAMLVDPKVPEKILSGIEEYMKHHGIGALSSLIGSLRTDAPAQLV